MKKTAFSTLALAAALSTALLPASNAFAQYYDGPPRWDHRRPPPPPPRWEHRRHDNTGRVIAGGLAAGVIGGLIGGAIVNNSGPRYVEPPPPPPPRCWLEDRQVPNAYDGGWHIETIRACN